MPTPTMMPTIRLVVSPKPSRAGLTPGACSDVAITVALRRNDSTHQRAVLRSWFGEDPGSDPVNRAALDRTVQAARRTETANWLHLTVGWVFRQSESRGPHQSLTGTVGLRDRHPQNTHAFDRAQFIPVTEAACG